MGREERVWKDKPVHDEYSHGYKSFESAAIRKPVRCRRTTTADSKR
jgi:hypothetical protein